jgi:hypothetical protein
MDKGPRDRRRRKLVFFFFALIYFTNGNTQINYNVSSPLSLANTMRGGYFVESGLPPRHKLVVDVLL